MTRRRPSFVAVVVVAVVVSASCAGDGGGIRRPAGSLAWSTCDRDPAAECATLEVPLDWAEPAGSTIELALARYPAEGRRVGALVSNPGGPGASGLDHLFARPFDAELGRRFDLVSWDPRGVGESTEVRCGDSVPDFLTQDPSPDDESERRALDDAAAAVSSECGRTDGALLAHLGTDDMARDLEAIRVALGEPTLNYVGFSYGTAIGQRYLDLFPTNVRAMVLDGVVDPAEGLTGLLRGQVEAMDAAVRRAWAACDRSTQCPVDDAEATFDALAERVEESPLPADHPVGPAELSFANIYATYDPALWTPLMEAYALAGTGDGSGLWDLASGYYDLGGWTAYAATMCRDSAHPQGAIEWARATEALTRISAWAGPAIGNELLPCATWPVPPAPVTTPVVAPEAPPVLVVGNLGDAATPYDDARRVADTLARATLVTLRAEGHTAIGRSRCVDDLVDDYLVSLARPEGEPTCDPDGG